MKDSVKNNHKGSYLKSQAIEKGITQKQIQDDLGVSQQYVSALLNGKKSIGKRLAKKLSDLYDLDEALLLLGYGGSLENDNLSKREISEIKNKPHDEQMEILFKKIEDLEQTLIQFTLRDGQYLESIAAHLGVDMDCQKREADKKEKSGSN